MSQPQTAAACGTINIGDITVNRLGFGALHVTGSHVWGEPTDRLNAIKLLQALPDLGINFIDTADAYGPHVSEAIIHEALSPYKGLTIATKGGLTRPYPNTFRPVGHPDYLKQCIRMSARRLEREQIDLWQLHRIDPAIPREVQFEAIAEMQQEGLIRHVGLSEVTVEDIEAAKAYFPVVSVQNRYNLVDRGSEDVLTYCEQNNIAFIPWFPLAAGSLAQNETVLGEIAKNLEASPAQVALAWVLKRSPVMLPIPGTSKLKHLQENVYAASLQLSEDDFKKLDTAGREEWLAQQSG